MTRTVVEARALPRDDAWDAFVRTAAGGHYVQTSRWARVKATLGWSAARVTVREGADIVAGCQLLVRRLGPAGVAYAPRGPLLGDASSDVEAAVLDGLEEVMRAGRLVLLKLQPPTHRGDLGGRLERRGYGASALEAAPLATVLVDLSLDEDELLARMRPSARSNIRKARRKGVEIRRGSAADLPAFTQIVSQTSERQGFAPFPRRYYEAMWEEFAPAGDAALLLAEQDGRTLSAALVLGYGETAVYKMGGWSGERSDVHPNELMHWAAFGWARSRRHRFYDFDGIPVDVARALLRGEDPAGARGGTARFKLGFGGEVRVFPGAYDRGRPRAVGTAATWAAPRLQGAARRLLGRGRSD